MFERWDVRLCFHNLLVCKMSAMFLCFNTITETLTHIADQPQIIGHFFSNYYWPAPRHNLVISSVMRKACDSIHACWFHNHISFFFATHTFNSSDRISSIICCVWTNYLTDLIKVNCVIFQFLYLLQWICLHFVEHFSWGTWRCCLMFVNALLFQYKTRRDSSVMHVSIKNWSQEEWPFTIYKWTTEQISQVSRVEEFWKFIKMVKKSG